MSIHQNHSLWPHCVFRSVSFCAIYSRNRLVNVCWCGVAHAHHRIFSTLTSQAHVHGREIAEQKSVISCVAVRGYVQYACDQWDKLWFSALCAAEMLNPVQNIKKTPYKHWEKETEKHTNTLDIDRNYEFSICDLSRCPFHANCVPYCGVIYLHLYLNFLLAFNFWCRNESKWLYFLAVNVFYTVNDTTGR